MQLEFEVSNYNLGADAFKRKNYKESVFYYTKSIEDNPLISFSQAYLWRGLSYYFLNDFENAIDDFNEASLGIQNELRLHNWRGLSYKETGRYQQAIDDFKKAIDVDAKFRDAYVELYEIGFITDNFELSNEYYNKLLHLGANNINLFVVRADNNSKNNNCELAIKMCDFILSKIPNEINSLQIRGTSNGQLLNYGLALNDFNKYIELNPKEATGYYNRAVLLRLLNKDGANLDFLQAYELGMDIAKTYITG